nr:MAG: ORF1 [TTV-like mini virus]
MPPYWKRRYTRRYRRRRPWFSRRRARQTFRRKYTRRWTYRRRHKVKRKRFFKKRLKVTVRQFNPKSIRKCKIIGSKCLVQGSPLRMQHNYIQYAESHVPKFYPGGGGWSLMVFSLDSLYEDFNKLQNIWTTSNAGLPLVRYQGCSFKFYQTEDVDYLVIYDTCWPMVDTPYTHADSSPQSMFLKKRKITIPSRRTQQRKKPYKKVFIHPPSQMKTHWYFQRDICKTPLLMLTTTTVSLTCSQAAPEAKSNNVTIKLLNTTVFQNLNFQTYPKTTGYYCKTYTDGTVSHRMYLYYSETETQKHNPSQAIEITKDKIAEHKLIALANTLDFTTGQTITSNNWECKPSNFGNPFHHLFTEPTAAIYVGYVSPYDIKNILAGTDHRTLSLTLLTEPFFVEGRYNPETDKGDKNSVYLLSTSNSNILNPPENENLIFSGFPLPILTWGWTDWIKKAKQMQDPDQNGILAFKTDQINIKQALYIPIDQDFQDGLDPYTPHPEHGTTPDISAYSKTHWYPKLQFQEQNINNICCSQPGTARVPYNHYMQIFAKYKFYFKWGGCPKQLEKAYDPCSQSIWTTPDNFHGRLEIQNPHTSPDTELWSWDWEGDYVTEEAIERIKQHTPLTETNVLSTESKNQPKTAQKRKKTEKTSQEAQATLLNQLQQLQQQQQFLNLLLSNRLST